MDSTEEGAAYFAESGDPGKRYKEPAEEETTVVCEIPPLARLAALYDGLGDIEKDVWMDASLGLAERLAQGQADYGVFQENDNRDWATEAQEEGLDMLVYVSLARRLSR